MAILLGLWALWLYFNCVTVEAQLLVGVTNDTCNLSTEFYDQTALGCSQCVISNGASTLSNSWLVSETTTVDTFQVVTPLSINFRYQTTVLGSLDWQQPALARTRTGIFSL